LKTLTRPRQATVFALLFALSAAIMVWLALDAYAYFLCALPLLACAVLLWRGRGLRWFKGLLLANQITAIVLILDLWLGDMLHLPKLTISAAMLAANLVLGGPLMGVLAIFALGWLHFNVALPVWLKAGQQKKEGA
jgi:hypothetical protein